MKNIEKITGLFTGLIEVWRDIPDYEGVYQISSFGNVKSLSRTRLTKSGSFCVVQERILKQKITKSGYCAVHFRTNKESHPNVHRLVAEVFLLNEMNKPTVNHKNSNKKNNNVSNLEWSTHSEQMIHAVNNDLLEVRGSPKYSPDFKKQISDYYKTNNCSLMELVRIFNISERTAGRIVKGEIEPKTKLSRENVIDIINLREEGKTLLSISKLFNCGISQIHRITKKESRSLIYERN
jgi:hypothetical protein